MHNFLLFNMIHDHRSTCTTCPLFLKWIHKHISNYFYMHILKISSIFRFFFFSGPLPSHLQVSNSTDMSIIVWRTGTGERLSTISAVRDMPRLGPWRNVLGWPVAGVPWQKNWGRGGWGLPWEFSGKTICTVYICNILWCKWCEQFFFF